MKRIKATFAAESPARSAGLQRDRAEKDGFFCACGKHQFFSAYIMAHWADSLQHRCQQCGRVHKIKQGVVNEVSGPVKRVSRVKAGDAPKALDPRVALWRCYQVLNNGGRPVTYQPSGDYSESLDTANAQGWDYANRVEPNVKARRDDLYRTLLRREEFPLLSTVEADGLIVGGGDLQMVGIRKDEVRGVDVREFELRDPKGRTIRVSLLPEVFAEIMKAFEYKPMTSAEALKAAKKEQDE